MHVLREYVYENMYISAYVDVSMCVYNYPSIYLPTYLIIYLLVCPIILSTYQPIYLSICLFFFLSLSLCICRHEETNNHICIYIDIDTYV